VLAAGRQPVAERHPLSAQTRLEDALFMGLRLTSGIDVAQMNSRYATDIWGVYGNELRPFVDEGLLIYDHARLQLTRPGMLLANEIMAVFISSPVR
jgi:oxygen-independent coproporphyrinogen-3 oxidase